MSKINSAPPGGQLMSITEAAGYLGVKASFVRALVQERRIVSFRVGRLVRIRRGDLDAFLEAGRRDVWPR